MMLSRRSTHWITRSNGYYGWRRPSGVRFKRKPAGLTLARQSSTSKSMPNPYWTSKLTNSLERLQSKTRLKLNARVLFDSIAAFRDAHVQRIAFMLRSNASMTQPRLQNEASARDLKVQDRSQNYTAEDGRTTDVGGTKRALTSGSQIGSWRELLRKAITLGQGVEDSQMMRLGVQLVKDKSLDDAGEIMVRDPAKGEASWQEFAKAQESEVNKILSEMELAQDQKPEPQKKEEAAAADSKSKLPAMSQVEIDRTARVLLKSVVVASSPASQVARLEELNNHVLNYPSSLCVLVKERAIAHILRMREYSNNSSVVAMARETLALLGYVDPPSGRGLRILSIDGGGTR